MATNTDVTILNVQTGEAVKNIQDLRDNIKALKAAMNEATIGSDEFKEAQAALTVNQNALRNAMHASTASIEDVSAAAMGAGQSYNALVAQMAKLKEELRATDVSTEEGRQRFGELAKQINATNQQLKDMDAAQGNYQRNVGNYTGALQNFAAAFQGMGAGAAGVVAPIGAANTALKALSANPIMGTVALLVTIFMKLVDAMKSNEEGSNALRLALAPLQAVGDFVTRALQALGNALGGIVKHMTNLAQKIIPGLKKQMEEREKAVQAQIANQQRVREINEANAKSEQRIATLRAEMADKEKNDAETRLRYAKEWQAELLAIAERNKERARTELAIAQAEADRAGNSKEENDALSAAKIKLIEVETAYQEQLRRTNRELTTIRKELKEAGGDADEFALELEEGAMELNEKLDLTSKDMQKFYETRAELEDRTLEMQKRRNALTIEDEEKRAAEDYRITVEANERKMQYLSEAIEQELDPTRRLELLQQRADLELTIEEQAAAESKRIDDKKTADAEENAKKRQEILQGYAGAVSGILGGLADLYENSENQDEKTAKTAKALRIAEATIQMISGAVAAYSSAAKLGPPHGPIIGAANAAAVIAAGTANIAKIRATKVSKNASGDGGTTAAVAAPSVPTSVTRVATLTTASDEVRINEQQQAQRVYILSSDLEADRTSRRVRVQETTF